MLKILYDNPYLEKYFPLCKVCASISIQEDAIGDLPRPGSVSCQATPRPRSPILKNLFVPFFFKNFFLLKTKTTFNKKREGRGLSLRLTLNDILIIP